MQEGLGLDCICNVKYGPFFGVARPFLDTRIFIHDFFWYLCVFKIKLNNFLIGSFLIELVLVKRCQLQNAITQIFESFFNINTL